MVHSDEKGPIFIPRLAVWLADHIENCTLHGIATNQCPVYIAPADTFGEFSQSPSPRARQYAAYYQRSDVLSLRQARIKNINNTLWHVTGFQP